VVEGLAAKIEDDLLTKHRDEIEAGARRDGHDRGDADDGPPLLCDVAEVLGFETFVDHPAGKQRDD
jgi:hypothetical protein